MQVTVRIPTLQLAVRTFTMVRTDRLAMWLAVGALGWVLCGFSLICLQAAFAIARWQEDQTRAAQNLNAQIERTFQTRLDRTDSASVYKSFKRTDEVHIPRPGTSVWCQDNAGRDITPAQVAAGAAEFVIVFERKETGRCIVR